MLLVIGITSYLVTLYSQFSAYLSRPENFNIILLNWAELAPFPWYRTAVENVKLVGQVLRNFIKLFTQTGEILIQRLHIIGFSLGSHIASMAGKGLQGTARIPRITALDPAFPEFSLQGNIHFLLFPLYFKMDEELYIFQVI